MTRRTFDDPHELRKVLLRLRSSVLEAPKERELELGPGWDFGRLGLVKGYPQFEESDLPVDLMSDAAFRKIPFDFSEEGLCGFAAALAYARAGEREHEALAGWVSREREQELDEWIRFLNEEIRRSHQAHPDVGPFVERSTERLSRLK